MANTIHVDVVSAEEQIFSGEAEFVVLPGVDGRARHLPAAHAAAHADQARARCGSSCRTQDAEEFVFVQGGFLEVQPHHVTVLADTAIRAKDLDEVAALEAKKAAEEAMQNKTSERGDRARRGRARRRARAARGDPQAASTAPDRATGRHARHRRGRLRRPFFVRRARRRGIMLRRNIALRAVSGLPASRGPGMSDFTNRTFDEIAIGAVGDQRRGR